MKMLINLSFFTTRLNKVEVILYAIMVFELVPRISKPWSRRRKKATLLMARWEGGGGQNDELNKLTLRSAWPTSITWGSRVKQRCILGGGTAHLPQIRSLSGRTVADVRAEGGASWIPCTTMLKCMETRLLEPRRGERAGSQPVQEFYGHRARAACGHGGTHCQ